MRLEPVVEEFFETKPDLLGQIKAFEEHRGLKLLRKLVKDGDEVNFFSWLSEVRFGLFFDKMCEDILNECIMESQRPDWALMMNGQEIIAEVLRINTPDEEYRVAIAQNRQHRKFQKENPGIPIIMKGPIKTVDLKYLGSGQSKLSQKEEKYRERERESYMQKMML